MPAVSLPPRHSQHPSLRNGSGSSVTHIRNLPHENFLSPVSCSVSNISSLFCVGTLRVVATLRSSPWTRMPHFKTKKCQIVTRTEGNVLLLGQRTLLQTRLNRS